MANNIRNLTGKILGNCTLERLIGQGGMGAVYLARQLRPARYVAVKILVPPDANNDELYQEFLARFRREADVIARLEHVNIMPVYEYGEQDGLAFLVMPYLTGGSLRDILRQRGHLTSDEAATYIDQAASALDYAHAQGVIHRDLKPANFLLHADGRLVLADFGIARIMEESSSGNTLTGIGTVLGTPEYMAPEMANGSAVDYRADIYELGVVLYQMLSGRVPFTGTTPYAVVIKQMQEPLPSLSQSDPSIPPAVDAVIRKATAKQREARYNTAKELAQAFRAAIHGTALPFNDPYAGPTVAASPGPMLLPSVPQYPQYPPTVPQRDLPNTIPPVGANAQYNPQYAHPVTPYNTLNATQPQRRQPLLWVLLGLVAILLLVGGTIVGIQISRNTATGPATGTATAGITTPAATATGGSTPTSAPTATAQPSPTTAPTRQPTVTPVVGLPIGAQLYATNAPGQNCDKNGGQWTDFNNATIECQGARTKLTNNAQAGLQGTFLENIPNHTYPSDYVIRTQIRPETGSNADFGVYFRNQPGGNQQGTYTFMIHADNTWSIYVYNNASAARTQLAQGTLRNAHTLLMLDIAVVGQQITVYANGRQLGTITDATYPSGNAGIAVEQGGTIYVSGFTLYAIAGQ